MADFVFSIAKDFSPNPGPRYKRQGANSGEALRPKLLKMLGSRPGRIRVVLDGTKGMGSSFLDEAFGGLILHEGKRKHELEKRFRFVSEVDPSYIRTIADSLERAERQVS